MKKIELLAPAGNIEKLKYALAYGADAVYAGIPKYSLRVKDNDFSLEALEESIRYTHSLGKRIYLTLNIFPHNRKLSSFQQILKTVGNMRPDGIIISDPGVLMLARTFCPDLPVHLSTQANTINWMSVKFWSEMGVSRIILSRELSIEEIAEIRAKNKKIELESFVHGAICVAYSGRCLLSNYFNRRDPNQGTCTNSCRWRYKVYTGKSDSYFLEEEERPGEFLPVTEDDHGTYIMNSKDLCTIQILHKLKESGIDSFKIEGRTKSIYYLCVITRAYRLALDKLDENNTPDSSIIREVYAVANRGYTTGFLERNTEIDIQNYASSQSQNQTHLFCGQITAFNPELKQASLSVRNRIETGDLMEIISPPPAPIRQFKVKAMYSMEGSELDKAHGGGVAVKIQIPFQIPAYSLLRKVMIM